MRWVAPLSGLVGLDEARRLGEVAVESARRQPPYTAHALHLLGDVATHPDRFDRGAARITTSRHLPSPSRAACARASPTATSASASSTRGRLNASARRNTCHPSSRCSASWTCRRARRAACGRGAVDRSGPTDRSPAFGRSARSVRRVVPPRPARAGLHHRGGTSFSNTDGQRDETSS